MLKWAYAEADLLIRRNQVTLTEISKRLTGGATTVGDCVAAEEGRNGKRLVVLEGKRRFVCYD
jgi:hypothetical protein